MKRILFLDFDGVLHPDGVALFSKLRLFEEHVLRMPEVEIVISSTWREDHSLDELRSYFSVPLRDRIIGVTPSLEDGYDCGGRQREIEAFLDSAGCSSDNASWVALDDMPLFFASHYPHLILTDSAQGFTESNGQALLQWYERSRRSP
jgi:hypothetical protein